MCLDLLLLLLFPAIRDSLITDMGHFLHNSSCFIPVEVFKKNHGGSGAEFSEHFLDVAEYLPSICRVFAEYLPSICRVHLFL